MFAILKRQCRRKVLVNQVFVERPELSPVGRLRALGVEVVRIECSHMLEHAAIVVVAEVVIGVLAVPCVERVIPNHVKGRLGQVVLEYVVKILIVAPRHPYGAQPAVFPVLP